MTLPLNKILPPLFWLDKLSPTGYRSPHLSVAAYMISFINPSLDLMSLKQLSDFYRMVLNAKEKSHYADDKAKESIFLVGGTEMLRSFVYIGTPQ